eukprot:scaffold3826_cov407-Prasinococcus_capsulatus_cf.AAC.5
MDTTTARVVGKPLCAPHETDHFEVSDRIVEDTYPQGDVEDKEAQHSPKYSLASDLTVHRSWQCSGSYARTILISTQDTSSNVPSTTREYTAGSKGARWIHEYACEKHETIHELCAAAYSDTAQTNRWNRLCMFTVSSLCCTTVRCKAKAITEVHRKLAKLKNWESDSGPLRAGRTGPRSSRRTGKRQRRTTRRPSERKISEVDGNVYAGKLIQLSIAEVVQHAVAAALPIVRNQAPSRSKTFAEDSKESLASPQVEHDHLDGSSGGAVRPILFATAVLNSPSTYGNRQKGRTPG